MEDQADIHWKSISDKVEDRIDAVSQFRKNFAVLPDKDAAWRDLIRLNGDEDIYVRWGAADALGATFPQVPDKDAAWHDLIRLTGDEDSEVRSWAASALGDAFSAVPDKDAAWQDLHRLTGDEDSDVRIGAANALGAAFSQIPDKDAGWRDLIHLTGDEDDSVRREAAKVLGMAFPRVPDKESAWQDLHRLTNDQNRDVRWWATDALCTAFFHFPEIESAWQDLHRLTYDDDNLVRSVAANVLGMAFPRVPDKESAWQDLHRLTGDQNRYVRWGSAVALGLSFVHISDKESAWRDLHRLTSDEDVSVRRWAASSIGSVFSHVPDKETAWVAMVNLSGDHERDVRVFANHSMGRASIFKATEAEGEEDFIQKLETALEYFEKSAAEAQYPNPAKFCLPFYRSFYVLTFKKEGSEAEVQKSLAEAKSASEGSKSKEDLLEALENLSNALKEAQGLQDKSLYDVKRDLKVYSQYCNRFAELLENQEEKAPRTVKLLRIGGIRVDKQIKETIAEIQEVAKELCKMTVGTEVEPLGREVNQQAREISSENYLISEKSIIRIADILEDMCKLLPPKKREHACELIEEICKCCALEGRIIRLEAAINYIQPKIDIERYGKQFEYIKSELDEIKLGMKELQQKILDRLGENEKAIISTILDQSSQDQMDEMLDLVKQVLSEIQHQELRGPVTSGDVEHLSEVIDDTRLSAADKLKVTLPLIPYFLQYEHEITLEKGVNLSAAWDRLVGRAKGKK